MVRKLIEFPNISIQCYVKFLAAYQEPVLALSIDEPIATILSRELELAGYDNYQRNIKGEFTNLPLFITPSATGKLTSEQWSRLDGQQIEMNGSFSFCLKRSEYTTAGMKYTIDITCMEAWVMSQSDL